MRDRDAVKANHLMKQNELRVKVAELCGWVFLPDFKNATAQGFGFLGTGQEMQRVPDYPNDLNACAEMEATLDSDPNLAAKYADTLADSLAGGRWYLIVRATAEQRCRAFVATMEGTI